MRSPSAMSALVLAQLPVLASAHGVLVRPISRAARIIANTTDGVSFGGSCPGGRACLWYTQGTVVPAGQKRTVCGKGLRTLGVDCDTPSPPGDFPCTPGAAVPWCAPGTAPVVSPCGVWAGGAAPLAGGRDMRDLDGTPMATWTAGSEAEVVWAVTANHGGGYSYRLCPADGDLSEECFQSNHLEFSGSKQWIVGPKDDVLAEIDATRLSEGTHPKGSQWTVNPFPQEKGYLPAIPGHPMMYGRGPYNASVKDLVKVPADLPSGRYVLSWRWDAEQTKQVWAQCSDVMVVNAKKPVPAPVPSKYVPSGKYLCQGVSMGLAVKECDAWVELFDALNGKNWPVPWGAGCDLRLDPCGCGAQWKKSIQCSSLRNFKSIEELYILGDEVTGTIPASIAELQNLKALSLVDTKLTGSLPESMGSMKKLQFLWLDHNPSLGGAIPMSMAQIPNLIAFELHFSNFTGALPPFPFRAINDCHVDGNVFACPLPKDAETCGAVCK
eukprot:TRINITY_DN1059_c0_g1_i1.p2 TRINITY_DN1059_c0_g1~~TRINITY_DN1059_c0_g1_i1.p2  ORF type:complete len:496 (+),score=191.29 TRINITY_DN1059_c0_g1_i1:68-1555(+)